MLGRYNLTPANRKGGQKAEVYEFGGEFYGTMNALMGAGITIDIERAMESSMNAEAVLRFGYDARMNTAASLTANVLIRMMVEKKADYLSEMSANMQRVIEHRMSLDSAMEADLSMAVNVQPHGELFGDLKALWNSLQIKETVMRFENLTIPPGGTVVIDSEFFTAAADGENIVDLYEGDWLMLTSRLKAIEARGISSGDLDVKVLYREMYL